MEAHGQLPHLIFPDRLRLELQAHARARGNFRHSIDHDQWMRQQSIQPWEVFKEQPIVDGSQEMHINFLVEVRGHETMIGVCQMRDL